MRPASLSATVSWFARKPRFGRKVRWLGFLLMLFATAAGGGLVLNSISRKIIFGRILMLLI